MSLPLERATYRAIAVATTLGLSNQKGTKYIAVNFEIVDHEHYTGEITPAWMGYFTDKSEARTVESLQHMGYEGDDLSDFADLDRDGCARLLPTPVELVCEPESYTDEQGNTTDRLRIQWVNRVGGGRFKAEKPLEGSELKAFSAQMKSVFRNTRGPKQATPQRPSNGGAGGYRSSSAHPNAPGNGNDDVPFATCDMAFEPSPIARVLR
jgi:hypothetical protein